MGPFVVWWGIYGRSIHPTAGSEKDLYGAVIPATCDRAGEAESGLPRGVLRGLATGYLLPILVSSWSRRTRRRTFPTTEVGSSSRNSTNLGRL